MRRTRSATLAISIIALRSLAHSMKVKRRCLPDGPKQDVRPSSARRSQWLARLTRYDSDRTPNLSEIMLRETLDERFEKRRLPDLARRKARVAVNQLHKQGSQGCRNQRNSSLPYSRRSDESDDDGGRLVVWCPVDEGDV
jgi:hypothetical protein